MADAALIHVRVHHLNAIVLVDTGLGLRDVADPAGRLSRFFLFLLEAEFRAFGTSSAGRATPTCTPGLRV